jgi:hypothetical protein
VAASDVALLAAALSLVAATLSALIAATTALRVARSQHELARNREQEATAIARSVEFVAASHAVSVVISGIAYASRAEGRRVQDLSDDVTDRINSALAAIRIADPPDVAAAAVALDAGLSKLMDDAKARRWPREEWRLRRTGVEALMSEFVDSSRRSIERRRRP